MNIEWEYCLPTNENSKDCQYECPIFIKDGKLYFISSLDDTVLHIINIKDGCEFSKITLDGYSTISVNYFFCEYCDRIVIYTGTLWILENQTIHKIKEFTFENKINSHIICGNKFYFSDSSRLYCFDLDLLKYCWDIDISNTTYYRSGELSVFDKNIVCYGNDKLLFICPDSGEVMYEIKISRADKLFSPIILDENTILLGYTNWSNAGVIRYDTRNKKVVWKSKRSFEGPLLRCKIYKHEKYAYWVKNDTELICLDTDSGNEVYSIKTEPWLYTDLQFIDDRILFGTAGRDGYFVNIDCHSGHDNRSVFLKNGCAFYDVYKNTVVGDFNKNVYMIDIEAGNKTKTLFVGAEVVGDVLTEDNNCYTVIWGNEDLPVRLIKIKL